MEVIAEKDIEVVIGSIGEVSTNSALEVDVIDNNELAVSVNRKEFNIVGDELYIPKRYEDAPQWLRDLISTVTEESYARKITDLNNLSASLQQLIVELEVAKNTYTQSIISSNDINERINTAITTLNSSLSGSDATIVDLVSTKATPEEASAIALNTISSSINNGEIGALVGSVSNTLTTETEALANNIDLVHAEMLGGFESTADVIQTTQAYVGIDEAGASTGTGLSAYLEDSLGNIGGADSQVANAVYINNGVPTSKFEYTSDLSKNGVHYKSGFGLKTLATGGDGSAANPYDSEFWINAAKFKFTNDNVTGQVAPFTIDATGLTPNITFNGKVAFTNVTGYTPPDVSGTINANNNTFAQKLGYADYSAMVASASSGQTIINSGYINTNLIQANAITANQINTTGLVAENISANTIYGKKITGGSMYGTYIEGAVIKASFIDLSGTATLTNWQKYTPATYPSAYDANFAKNNNGTLLVDSQGYVRLMGNTQLVSGGISHTNNYVPNSNYTPAASIPAYEISIHGYDDYTKYTINRMINSTHTMSLSANQVFNFASVAGIVPGTGNGYCSGSFYVNSDYYEIYIYQSMNKSIYSSSSGYIKKNGVTVASSTAQAAVMVSYSISILGFSCTLSGGLSAYGGVNFSLKSNNVINSGTALSISNLYGPAFKLVSAYATQRMSMSSSIPVITII